MAWDKKRAVLSQARALDRVLDRQSMHPMVTEFDNQAASVVQRLSRSHRSRKKEASPSDIARAVRDAQKLTQQMYRKLGRELAATTSETVREAVRQQALLFRRLTGSGSILDADHVVARVVRSLKRDIEAQRRTAMADVSAQVQRDIKLHGMQASGSIADVVDVIAERTDAHLAQVQKIVRLETSYAFSEAQSVAIDELSVDHPGVMKRWTEKVDDATGQPMDKRVALDSIVLHGQIADRGAKFKMPSDRRLKSGGFDRMIGDEWYAPPNRPYDRAIIIPWLPTMGIPAYKFDRIGRRRRVR